MDIIIRDGLIVTGSEIFKADIGIENGKITCISDNLLEPARDEINAEGKYVFPGFIDVHTHLDMPLTDEISSADDFYTGTLAAAFGGTTCIVDYIVPMKNQTLKDAYKMWQRKAMEKAVIDYGFHMTISNPTENILNEVKDLESLGITSVKCFTTYVNKFMMTDDQIFRLLKESKESKILLSMHCENGYIYDYLVKELIKEGKIALKYHPLSRPPLVEEESVGRVIDLAKLADAPIYIAHISTEGALIKVKKARDQAYGVYAETCPQYLLLSDKLYKSKDDEPAKYICSPPLRHESNQNELWKGIFSGDIQVIGTDHCPFNLESDRQIGMNDFTKMPNGLPGIEDRVNIIFSEGVIKRKLDLNKFVATMSLLPAKIFGLYPQKGNINVSADADLVVYDPDEKWVISAKNHHQNVDYNPYEGIKVTGKPEYVISNGEIIIRNNEFIGQKGRGSYIKRKPSVLL